jgi:hypothetical protein
VEEAILNPTTGKYGAFAPVAAGYTVSGTTYTPKSTGFIAGTQTKNGVVTAAPGTSFFDTSSAALRAGTAPIGRPDW